MKTKILATVSVLAMMVAMPAYAAETQLSKDITQAYEEIRAIVIGNEVSKNEPLVIDSRRTASGMIGHNVYNEKNEQVAVVRDIIIDKTGKAVMIVVSDASFIQSGKTAAAFDYAAVSRIEENGDIIMPITETIISNASAFSYDRDDASDSVRVMPEDGFSTARLLKGRLINQEKEAIADVENITMKNGYATMLIVGFDKTMGFGGTLAAIAFEEVTLLRYGNSLDFQLTADKAVQFEAYKKMAEKQ